MRRKKIKFNKKDISKIVREVLSFFLFYTSDECIKKIPKRKLIKANIYIASLYISTGLLLKYALSLNVSLTILFSLVFFSVCSLVAQYLNSEIERVYLNKS